jgi:hypothetical protein
LPSWGLHWILDIVPSKTIIVYSWNKWLYSCRMFDVKPTNIFNKECGVMDVLCVSYCRSSAEAFLLCLFSVNIITICTVVYYKTVSHCYIFLTLVCDLNAIKYPCAVVFW